MKRVLPLLFLFVLLLTGCYDEEAAVPAVSLDELPAYAGEPYVAVNANQPFFEETDYTTEAFETYSELDDLGRCGPAWACVGTELMPTEDRESISSVTPSGWINVEYDGQYLYNRCHLIGFQLTGENANERNLITGTRYMNVDGVASGVLMEALSMEDDGEGVCFNVYVYNVQPGIAIDYATGESWAEGETAPAEDTQTPAETTYILNTSSKKFHLPDCSGVASMNPANQQTYVGSREALLDEGYSPCGQCNP